jgi:hypothetical protein
MNKIELGIVNQIAYEEIYETLRAEGKADLETKEKIAKWALEAYEKFDKVKWDKESVDVLSQAHKAISDTRITDWESAIADFIHFKIEQTRL